MCPDIYLSPLSPHHSFTLSLCIVSGCWLPFIVSSAITQRSSTPAKAVKPALKCSSFRPYMTRVNRFLVVFVFSAIFFVCQLYWNSTGLWRKCPFTGRGMLIKNGSTLISNWQVHALGICFVDFVKQNHIMWIFQTHRPWLFFSCASADDEGGGKWALCEFSLHLQVLHPLDELTHGNTAVSE